MPWADTQPVPELTAVDIDLDDLAIQAIAMAQIKVRIDLDADPEGGWVTRPAVWAR